MLGEHVSARLWVGFGIVWVALVLLSIDSLRTANAARTERRRVAVTVPDAGPAPMRRNPAPERRVSRRAREPSG